METFSRILDLLILALYDNSVLLHIMHMKGESFMQYSEMSTEIRNAELKALREEYENVKAQKLSLNMARGKPGKQQLDIVNGMFDVLKNDSDFMCDGMDVRNYGELLGLPSARKLFADLLDTTPDRVFAGGNSSLTLMYTLLSMACTNGLKNSPRPWSMEPDRKFLCPAPGYDRHFLVTESLGFELITIPMTENGPDMDLVEKYVSDPSVKGIWCVPKYSNPDGIVYSDETLTRLTQIRPAAPDFTVMWDNAYCVHEFACDYRPFTDILGLAEKNGTEDLFYEFASTSKITLPGAGVACMACSVSNLNYLKKLLNAAMISFDKVNQYRHVLYLKDKAGILELMKKHANVVAPKFDLVLRKLDNELKPLGIAKYTRPVGGYFVSFYGPKGTAKRVWQLCKEAGVVLTNAGAAYPHGIDPDDSHIRIAPTLPPIAELEKAMDVFCLCVRIASLEQAG